MSQNRYIYAADNPERYVDPSGNRFILCGGGGGYSYVGPAYSNTASATTSTRIPNQISRIISYSSQHSSSNSKYISANSQLNSYSQSTTITATQTSTQTLTVTSSSGSSSVTTSTQSASSNSLTNQFSGIGSFFNGLGSLLDRGLFAGTPEQKIAVGVGLVIVGAVVFGATPFLVAAADAIPVEGEANIPESWIEVNEGGGNLGLGIIGAGVTSILIGWKEL